eukprot:GHRR01017335.1.p1 GENE.GHRR01017335.1~~GHRR01017335.1.p1  ORF type:complete len:278 (+),score=88.77 GHRR01017335.1:808-1641(+)
MALPAHNSRRWVGTQQCNTFKQLHPFNQLIPSAHRCQTSYQKDRQATTIDSAAACSLSRRGALLASLLLSAPGLVAWPAHAAASKQKINPRLIEAFQKAMAANGNYEAMEAGWTQAINIDPNSAPAWSNRGTARLQNSQWQAAYEDLAHALQLEQQQTGQPSALLLNNLGNTEAALGQWQDAMQHYQQATEDSELSSIALANYALAAFEIGDAELAIKSARRVLCRLAASSANGPTTSSLCHINPASEGKLPAMHASRNLPGDEPVLSCWPDTSNVV